MNGLASKISEILISRNVIDRDDKEIYKYGLECYFLKLIHYFIILGSGIVAKKLIEMIIFMIIYSTLRKYAGGYHASSIYKCFIITVVISVINMFVFTVYPKGHYINFIFIFSALFIFCFAPVDTLVIPMTNLEKRKNRNAVRLFIFISILVYFLVGYIDMQTIKIPMVLSFFFETIMMILQLIKKNTIERGDDIYE